MDRRETDSRNASGQSRVTTTSQIILGGKIELYSDMMSAVTNHEYRATPHRVLENSAKVHRYSIPLFFNPHYFTTVQNFPAFVTEENPSVKPFVFGEHLKARLDATYSHRREDEK